MANMKIRYLGPHDGVEIPSVGVTVQQGHQVEVPEDVAKSLLQQEGSWEKVKGAK